MNSNNIKCILKVLYQAGLQPMLHTVAKSGSVYIKFKKDIGGALRISNHPQRSRYAYRWNLREDVKEIHSKDKNHLCHYYPFKEFERMVGDMIAESNLSSFAEESIKNLGVNKESGGIMFEPYQFQTEAIQSIFSYFRKGNRGNPLVVAPTGSGKSVIIAVFCQIVTNKWPTQRILVISHVKEILDQNYKAIREQLENKPIGLFSAGLRSKSIKKITVAGIQSIYNKPELFNQFDIIIVDECHKIPIRKDGMYNKFFLGVKRPIIGFTATPYRLGTGYLHLGANALFDDIVYSIPIKKLQDEGFLCKLTSKGNEEKMDTKDIKKQGGDYILKDLSLAFDREEVTKRIIKQLLLYKEVRNKWLVFAIDINHCEHITAELNSVGIKSAFVHSKMSGSRDEIIDAFRNGEYQALVSVAVLTTGFDVPDVDMIVLMRPTASPVLHVQIIGRGLRTAPGKNDCLVLDFAGNLLRNGPINAPVIKLSGKGTGDPILKECKECYEIVYAAVKKCPVCGYEFQFRHKLTLSAKERNIIESEEWHEVTDIKYFEYTGSRGIPMLKVSYMCGIRRFNEFVCLEHPGYAAHKAKHWWRRRSDEPAPETAREAVQLHDTLITPKRILVDESGKYDVIKEHDFSGV